MIEDWDELRVAISRAGLSAPQREADALWAAFVRLAARIPHVASMANRIRGAPIRDRLVAVSFVAQTLAPWDWLGELRPARRELREALDELKVATDPLRAGTLANALLPSSGDDTRLHIFGRNCIDHALTLVRAECAASTLRVIGTLCDTGIHLVGRTYGKFMPSGDKARENRIQDARGAYLHAFHGYARAAREVNRTLGEQVFLHLDSPLGE